MHARLHIDSRQTLKQYLLMVYLFNVCACFSVVLDVIVHAATRRKGVATDKCLGGLNFMFSGHLWL